MKDLEKQLRDSCYNYNTTTDSIRLERQIEEAAENYSIIKRDQIDSFIAGVKSPEAKEYWQKGMYTQEQMLSFADFIYSDYEDSHLGMNELFIEWFEQNKKKL